MNELSMDDALRKLLQHFFEDAVCADAREHLRRLSTLKWFESLSLSLSGVGCEQKRADARV